jgi:Spy/CpxP family protein refolding chaperone
MDKKVLVVILIISIAINLATVFTLGYFWWARHASRADVSVQQHPPPEWPHTRIVRELDLSEQQIEQMRRTNEEMRKAMQPLREELFRKRHELMSLLRADEIARDKADRLIAEIAELQARHEAQLFEHLVNMRSILTPEQQERLGALMYTLLESGRPPEMPHAPVHPHRPFELPRGENGR